MNHVETETSGPGRAVLITMLPGSDRKRTAALYQYRLIYREPRPDAEGCLLLWTVAGGRQTYQVALERDGRGELQWHCTCADHVYRSEKIEHHVCKHVRGLCDFASAIPAPLARAA